ncbi:MAG: Cryptopsoridial mucin, large thr stretch, signal peptide sequence [Microgenomates group bacterium GW2011_GWC1_39_12]|nr:MAG: Cryptopsoridial mucin, large thr stretch, signal peptide sequence [Microgenomates group bacterium GW2011_GWC1_39_12]
MISAGIYTIGSPVYATTCSQTNSSGTFSQTTACSFATSLPGVDYGTGSTNTAVLSVSNSTLTVATGTTIATGTISIGASGIVSIVGTVKLNTPLYWTDTDGDTYAADPASTPVSFTGGTGKVRMSQLASTTNYDCNDASASTYANLTCYQDADGDTYYSTSSHSVCGGATCAAAGESATVGTDCCDTDNRAKPGQTTYYTTARTTCGGYDFNCNSSEEQQETGNVILGTCTSNGSACVFGGGGNGGWTGSVPGCGNSAEYQDGGCCPYSAGDCPSAGQYPNCSVGGQYTSNPTQACR